MPWPAAGAGEGRQRREALSRAPGVKCLSLCSQGPLAAGSGEWGWGGGEIGGWGGPLLP